MMKTDICSFSGYKIYPGHGKRMVKTDGKVYQFLNGKCEASHLMKKNPRKVTWTVLYRRKHKKGIEEEAAKKRTRRTTKHQRAIVGASLSEILAKRNMNPEARKAQREQNTRAAKEKSKAAKNQKKTTSAPVKAVKVVNKQKAVKPVQAKAIRALNLASVVLAESPGCAEKVPERPSILLQTGEELSPKEGNMKKTIDISSENQKFANSPAGDLHVNPAAARGDVTAPKTAATTSATSASPASLNWADSEMAEVNDNEGFIVVKAKKRRLGSTSPEHAARQPNKPGEQRSSQQRKRPTGPRAVPPQEIKATRKNIAEAKVRQNSSTHENYIFVERCPEFPDYTYLKAISKLVGGPNDITYFGKMNGHFLVGLATKDLALRLAEGDLEIEGTTLRVFPYRKRAERIVVANLPGFVDDFTVVNALSPYGRVTSIAPILIKMGEFTFTDGRREAFILLKDGIKLDRLPTRLDIQSKGDSLPAFLSFGIKCSKCGKQGHRRANCPSLARQNSSPRQAARPTPAPATSASPVQPAKSSTEAPVTPSAHHPAEPRDLAQPAPVALPAPLAAPRPPEPETFPLDIEMSEEELTSTPSASPRGKPAFVQLQEHLKQFPNLSIDWDGLLGIDREDAQRLLTSKGKMEKRAPSLSKAQVAALDQETNAFHLGSGQDLCLGYSAVILAHPVAISGSGLACVFGPGVAVLRQRILWPGHIALATIDVRGEEMTAIAVHLAHEPRERNRQLELLAATAAQEEEGACWIIGDFNIRDRGPSSSSSSDALAALLDLAALVDVATQFDAAHLPTRVAMHGDQVESNRLDRILIPAGVLDRVSIYATSHYHLSDHRLVLLQVGPPTSAVSSPTQPRLAAMLRSGLVLEHLAGYIRELEEDTAHDDDDGILWYRWTTIKAGLLAEARSLHDPRHAASDSYVYRARRYIAAQLEASSIRADYPSLPDLARAIRLRRPVSVIRDEQDNIIEGPELRRRAFATFQPRFARPTSDPAAGAAFIASSAPTTTRELSEEDPLHRPDISPSEIANAIEHLPRGKAPGWDGLPCELLVAFSEDFFAEALARVFAASRLRGALPPSTRRSSICLVPKARGGRGLNGYRTVALPSADYRVLAAILHRRLKPHLRTLVPECQTYAVPGRSPSWNIAMVTDAVEEATALGSPLAVMGVDLESAFDSLDRGFLESLLISLRLPPAFLAWINILYAGADATIRAGGFYTTAFPLLNGLRQGCAVSAALFSIATGPLLRRLELTLGVGNVTAYADDIVLLFHRDEDFERVATVFENYKQASGVGVNLRKSAGLWCGAWRNRGDSPLGASWSTTSIRVLGLDIAPRSTVIHREQHLLALLETACRKWTPFTRGLSLVGRARAANTLVGSTIQHHLHGYLPSPPTIAKLQARLARIVWGPDHTA
ncbi:RPL24 [Cordylochernes scorpioides]|uniref:RPL24 n=1 Tax=Cordylochernes scorpioides TaxID=51811 RepID=A0ABY6KE41_9ARAC|nr:RPL24 [Cordylochernes scorpioides]